MFNIQITSKFNQFFNAKLSNNFNKFNNKVHNSIANFVPTFLHVIFSTA